MKPTKNCRNCDWGKMNELADIICCNPNSEYVADFRMPSHTCDKWEVDPQKGATHASINR